MMKATAAGLLLLPVVAACGSDDPTTETAEDRMTLAPADAESEGDGHTHGPDESEGDGHTHSHDDAHSRGDPGAMTGDPDATPANEIPGAELREGHFHALADAPEGTGDVGGHAWLARTDDGTTVTIDVTGLEAGADYMTHLHAESCEPNAGGDHFKFDPAGGDQPPNEVHLMVTADDAGNATATITNDNPGSEGAKAMVLHLADGTKFACADLAE